MMRAGAAGDVLRGRPDTTAAMRLHISDPDLLPELLAYLLERPDCIAVQAGGETIAVSLLGSRQVRENVLELEERLEPWRAENVGVLVELADAS